MGIIINIVDIGELGSTIANYDLIVSKMNKSMENNNMYFYDALKKLVNEMIL